LNSTRYGLPAEAKGGEKGARPDGPKKGMLVLREEGLEKEGGIPHFCQGEKGENSRPKKTARQKAGDLWLQKKM